MTTASTQAFATAALAVLVFAAPAAGAQTGANPQPYAGLEQRAIKALSPGQIDDYRNGRGMSLALAAELNGYPGPRHVLDLTEPLGLSPRQTAQVRTLFDRMRQDAAAIGESIVAREAELDALFAGASAQADTVETLTESIARLNGQLRNVHLRAHIAMRNLLDPAQIEAYAALRGYRPTPDGGGHGGHGGRH